MPKNLKILKGRQYNWSAQKFREGGSETSQTRFSPESRTVKSVSDSKSWKDFAIPHPWNILLNSKLGFPPNTPALSKFAKHCRPWSDIRPCSDEPRNPMIKVSSYLRIEIAPKLGEQPPSLTNNPVFIHSQSRQKFSGSWNFRIFDPLEREFFADHLCILSVICKTTLFFF